MSSIESAQLDEESKGLLRRIVERTAYRQLMAVNIRGHGMKYISGIEEKRALAIEMDSALQALRAIETLYASIGGTELTIVVRELMERVPYPYSMLELATCLLVVERTERLVLESYRTSRSREMAAIARDVLGADRPGTRALESHLAQFCSEAGNRPAAQQFLNRWMAIAIVAFGRPGSPGDQRAVALGLRSQRVEDLVRRFQGELKPFVANIGLALPSPSSLGVEVVA